MDSLVVKWVNEIVPRWSAEKMIFIVGFHKQLSLKLYMWMNENLEINSAILKGKHNVIKWMEVEKTRRKNNLSGLFKKKKLLYFSYIKSNIIALAGVAQWIDCWPVNLMLDRFPVRALVWIAGQVPSWGHVGGNWSISHIIVSLPLFLPPFTSLYK